MQQFTIPRVTVLHGHVSPETAYLVNDYPYGRTLRCQMRYWLQTATKGQYRGQTRLMRQSTNPKRGDALNPPKAWGQYSHFMVMYLDPTQQNRQGEDYVRTMACGFWLSPTFHARMTLTGALQQLTDEQRARYTTLLNISQGEANKRSWAEWDTLLGAVRQHVAEHRQPPQRTDNGIMLDRYVAEDAYLLAVACVVAETAAGGADDDR